VVIANKATAITFTLPAASALANPMYLVRNIGAGDLTVQRNGTPGTDTIEGASSIVLKTGHSALLYSDGSSAYRAIYRTASAENFQANAAGVLLPVDAAWKAAEVVDLGNLTGSVSLDFSTFINAKGATTGNFTLNAATNVKMGQKGHLEITLGGAHTLSLNSSYFVSAGGNGITLSGSGAVDVLGYAALDSGKVLVTAGAKAVA
jgi:hypothetical protein